MKEKFTEGFCITFGILLLLYIIVIMCLCFVLPAWLCATVSWWYVFTYTITIPIAGGLMNCLSFILNDDEEENN